MKDKKSLIYFFIVFVGVCAVGILFLLWQKVGFSGVVENMERIGIKKEENIQVFSPKTGDFVSEIFKVAGRARVFENQFNVRVLFNAEKIYEEGATSSAKEMGEFGEFEKEINLFNLGLAESADVILEVFDYSAKDGTEIDKVIIPLKFEKGESQKVKVYFNNDKLDPEFSCNKVFPTEREIPKTQAVARLALEELLKGPITKEKEQGFFTSINSGVKIQSLIIENSTARVDFDDQLEYQVGGSCRVAAIRSQITQTLKQFPTVKSVIISINGRTEDILQP